MLATGKAARTPSGEPRLSGDEAARRGEVVSRYVSSRSSTMFVVPRSDMTVT